MTNTKTICPFYRGRCWLDYALYSCCFKEYEKCSVYKNYQDHLMYPKVESLKPKKGEKNHET